ncbi:hypothetical protein D3C86_1623720 [compost metagenome]
MSTATSTTVAHHECELRPVATTGRCTPCPTSAVSADGAWSASQSHQSMATIATAPQPKASTACDTVSSRKKPAVPAAATTGSQPSVGRRSSWTGRAARALVTSVSRPPKTVPGSQWRPSSTSCGNDGCCHSGYGESTSGMLRTP